MKTHTRPHTRSVYWITLQYISDLLPPALLDGWICSQSASPPWLHVIPLFLFSSSPSLCSIYSLSCSEMKEKFFKKKKTLGVCSLYLIQSHTPRRAESNLLICRNAHTQLTQGSGNLESQQGDLHLSCLMNIHVIGCSCQELGLARHVYSWGRL